MAENKTAPTALSSAALIAASIAYMRANYDTA